MTLNDVASEFRGNSYVPTSVLALETPYDFFRHIFTPDLISTMTEQTRLYATQSRPHKPFLLRKEKWRSSWDPYCGCP